MKTEFTKGGFTHRQIKREGNIAIFERFKGDRRQLHWEVVRIRYCKAYTIAGVDFPAGEHYPSSEKWGADGWTFNDLGAAERKFDSLADLEAHP